MAKAPEVVQTEQVAKFKTATLHKDTHSDGHWSYRLMKNDALVARDRARHWLNEIMYQIG